MFFRLPDVLVRPFLSRLVPEVHAAVTGLSWTVAVVAAVVYLSARYTTIVETLIERIVDVCGTVAMWCCLALVLVTVHQVIAGLDVFNAASIGMQELEWHLFGVIFLLAGAYAQKLDAHVRVDIFYSRFTGRTKAWVNLLGVLLALMPTCAVIVWFGIDAVQRTAHYENVRAADFYTIGLAEPGSLLYGALAPVEGLLRKTLLIGEISPDPGGLEARWIIKAAIPFGLLLIMLQGVLMAIQSIRSLRGSTPGKVSVPGEGGAP